MNIERLKKGIQYCNILLPITNPKLDYAIRAAVEYMNNVVIMQERILSHLDFYKGYKATVGHFTEQSFYICLDAYIETLKQEGILP